MRVLIINYGMGNLGSVRRAFEESGADVLVTSDPTQLTTVDRVVLPGVGSFTEGMENLEKLGWPQALREGLKNPHLAFLGICLGMQLLADRGTEGGNTPGIGLIPGEVVQLQPQPSERIPHIGWNNVQIQHENRLFAGIPDEIDFYFVHSYHFCPQDHSSILGKTPYAGNFVSALHSGNVYAVQFHPEKSSHAGLRLIRNFLSHDLC